MRNLPSKADNVRAEPVFFHLKLFFDVFVAVFVDAA